MFSFLQNLIAVAVVVSGITVTASIQYEPELPAKANLYGFWPLTLKHDLVDFGGNKITPSIGSRGVPCPNSGPFGQPYSSFWTNDSSSMASLLRLGDFPNVRFTTNLTFSVSFAFEYNNPPVANGTFFNLVTFYPEKRNNSVLINYEFPNTLSIALANGNYKQGYHLQELARFPVFELGKWSFITLTYNGTAFAIYGRHGELLGGPLVTPLLTDLLDVVVDFAFGDSVCGKFGPWYECTKYLVYGFPGNSATISCIGIYNTSLDSKQSNQFFDSCESITNNSNVEIGPMPRQDTIQAFWPLDYSFGFTTPVRTDAAFTISINSYALSPFEGPYSTGAKTSLTSLPNRPGDIYVVGRSDRLLGSQYTVNCVFKATSIFALITQFDNYRTLVFSYVQPDLLRITNATDPSKPIIVAEFPVMRSGEWQSLSVSIDAVDQIINIYNENGQKIVRNFYSPSLFTVNTVAITSLGNVRGPLSFSATNAIACLSVYNSTLTVTEIEQVFKSCKLIKEAFN